MVGSTISALGYPESAVPVLEQAAKLAPKNFSLNSNLGLALSYLKRYPEALPYLEAAARLKPGDIPNRNEQAWAYFATGRTEDAVEIYRQVLQRHPQEITTCMNLALVYEQSGSGLARGQWQSCRELANTDPQKFQAFLPEIEKALSRLGP